MKTYHVRIRETLEMLVTVEAESMAQAKQIAEKGYKNSDYILDASHYKGVTFETLYPKNKDYER